MKRLIISGSLLCLLIAFGQKAPAQDIDFDFEPHSLEALDSPEQSTSAMRQTLGAVFPIGSDRTHILKTLEHLRQQTTARDLTRGDSVGDDTNIRDCRRVSSNVLSCVWFLFIPPQERKEAMAEGVYGLTWVLLFRFDGNDVLDSLGVDLLIERL
jgi:hypothetical protein